MLVLLTLGAACSGCSEDYSEYAGVYMHESRGMYTNAKIEVKGNKGYIHLSGGYVIESAPTDRYGGQCEIEVFGYFEGDKFLGSILPKEGMEHTKQDRWIAILFGDGWLDVKGYDGDEYCGYWMRMHGVYKKYSCTELKEIYHRELSYYRENPEELEDLCQ